MFLLNILITFEEKKFAELEELKEDVKENVKEDNEPELMDMCIERPPTLRNPTLRDYLD